MSEAGIIILNWNNWPDTVECLESVFRCDYPGFRVVVVDNGSVDGSVARILEWAGGGAELAVTGRLRQLVHPPVPKPIECLVLDRKSAQHGGGTRAPLVIIETGENLGFAGGNNVGLSYLMQWDDLRYFWLLNNDTVIEPDALTHLVRRLAEEPAAGMCGSTMPYYDHPERIWAQGGGTFNLWLAKSRCIGNGRPTGRPLPSERVERLLRYVAGASLLVSRPFLEQVGLLSEDYFLYYEEPDWSLRARGRFTLAYAPESVVYHKVGVSTAVINREASGGKPTDRYIFRNALLFTRKFFPVALPLVFVRVSFNRIRGYILNLILRREHKA